MILYIQVYFKCFLLGEIPPAVPYRCCFQSGLASTSHPAATTCPLHAACPGATPPYKPCHPPKKALHNPTSGPCSTIPCSSYRFPKWTDHARVSCPPGTRPHKGCTCPSQVPCTPPSSRRPCLLCGHSQNCLGRWRQISSDRYRLDRGARLVDRARWRRHHWRKCHNRSRALDHWATRPRTCRHWSIYGCPFQRAC